MPANNRPPISLTLPARLDGTSAPAFRSAVQQALDTHPRQLTLDCSALTYIDSTGLGLLTLARAAAHRSGCTVTLAGVRRPGAVADVLALVRFDHLFTISFTEAPL